VADRSDDFAARVARRELLDNFMHAGERTFSHSTYGQGLGHHASSRASLFVR
jgi:hypothetical protein